MVKPAHEKDIQHYSHQNHQIKTSVMVTPIRIAIVRKIDTN